MRVLTLLVLCQWVTAEMQQDGASGVPKADMEAEVGEELRRREEDLLKLHEARIQELIGELEHPDEAAGKQHLAVMADGFVGGGPHEQRGNQLEALARKVQAAEAEADGKQEYIDQLHDAINELRARGPMRRLSVDPSNELSLVGDTTLVSWNANTPGRRKFNCTSVGDGTMRCSGSFGSTDVRTASGSSLAMASSIMAGIRARGGVTSTQLIPPTLGDLCADPVASGCPGPIDGSSCGCPCITLRYHVTAAGTPTLLANDSSGYRRPTSECLAVLGNLAIRNVDSVGISPADAFHALKTVAGDLLITDNSGIVGVPAMPSLVSVGGSLRIFNNQALANLSQNFGDFPALTQVGGDLQVALNPNLEAIRNSLNNVTSVGGNLSISSNGALEVIRETLDGLLSVGGGLHVEHNPALTTLIALHSVDSVGSVVDISGNDALSSIGAIERICVYDSLNVDSNGDDAAIEQRIRSTACTWRVKAWAGASLISLVSMAATSASSGTSLNVSDALDGRPSTKWDSGAYPSDQLTWFEMNWTSPHTIAVIRGLVSQFPDGNTVHVITADGTEVAQWVGYTSLYQWLEHEFDPPIVASVVRITTTTSPSHVQWAEIQVLGPANVFTEQTRSFVSLEPYVVVQGSATSTATRPGTGVTLTSRIRPLMTGRTNQVQWLHVDFSANVSDVRVTKTHCRLVYTEAVGIACQGKEITQWSDGSDAQNGRIDLSVDECKAECTAHADTCVGINIDSGGACNWQFDITGSESSGHTCYIRAAYPGVFVDDTQATLYPNSAAWTYSTLTQWVGSSGYRGTVDPSASAVWTVPVSGRFRVSFWWGSDTGSGREPNTQITVTHAGGTSTTSVNLGANGNEWHVLGTYALDTSDTVTVSGPSSGATGALLADGLLFEDVDGTSSYASGCALGGQLSNYAGTKRWTPVSPSSTIGEDLTMQLVVDHVPVEARRERAVAAEVAASFATEVTHTLDPYTVPVACQLINEADCCRRLVFRQTVPTDLTCTTYEAEDAIAVGPVQINSITGYSGTGFMDYTSSPDGDYVEWSVNHMVAESVDVKWRYALGSGDRPLELSLNGAVVQTISFPATGSGSTWGYTAALTLALTAGSNTLRLTTNGNQGPNVDAMDVCPTSGLRSADEWSVNPTDPTADQYSILDQLHTLPKFWFDKFVFELVWPERDRQLWKQSSNPMNESIDGYEAVQLASTSGDWGGLAPSTNPSSTLIDGSPGSADAANWWYAVGARTWFGPAGGQGMPGYIDAVLGYSPSHKVELYAYTPCTPHAPARERCTCASGWTAADAGGSCAYEQVHANRSHVGCPNTACDGDANGPWCPTRDAAMCFDETAGGKGSRRFYCGTGDF